MSMRRALPFVLFLCAAAAWAQDEPAPAPDFSRAHLDELFRADAPPPPPRSNVQFHVGAIEFRAFGMDWRISYLPVLMPLSGSRAGISPMEMPDPFALARTPIATGPRAFGDRRAVNAERRRIERLAKVKARSK